MSNFEYVTSDGKIVCQLCGASFDKMTHMHLKFKHDNMTMAEYVKLFPDAPISNDSVRLSKSISNRFDTFKKNEEVLKDESEPIIIKKPITIKEIEPPPIQEKIIEDDGYGPFVHKDKIAILQFLSTCYPALINNFEIEFFTPAGLLEYKFQTDMADPISKTAFDFPNAIWHNTDIRPNIRKPQILKEKSWKIISFLSKNPTVKDISEKLDIIS